LGPFPTRPGQIAAEGRGVEIPFAVGQRVVLREPAQINVVADGPAGRNEARDKFVAGRIVVWRRCDGQTMRARREAEAEAIGLHSGGGIAWLAWVSFIEERKKRALRIASDDVGIERKIAIPNALAAFHATRRTGLQVIGSRQVFVRIVNTV